MEFKTKYPLSHAKIPLEDVKIPFRGKDTQRRFKCFKKALFVFSKSDVVITDYVAPSNVWSKAFYNHFFF